MHLSTVLLALTSTFTLAAADSYFCRPGQDKSGFIQKAYCCTKFIDVPGNEVGKESEGCTFFLFLFLSFLSPSLSLFLSPYSFFSLVLGAV